MIDITQFDDRRRREIDIAGEKFIFQCTDPYGYWYIHRPKGQLPKHLVENSYTELGYAVKAVENYLSEKPKPKPERPEIKFKPLKV